MDISKSLVELRKKVGMKQIVAAKKIGISQTYLSQIEGGSKEPSTEVIKKICGVYNIPVSVVYYMAMTVDDVQKSKKPLFLQLKPIIDSLITQLIPLTQ